MKLTVKTLKGGKFTVEVDPSNTVAEAKGIIVSRVESSPPLDLSDASTYYSLQCRTDRQMMSRVL